MTTPNDLTFNRWYGHCVDPRTNTCKFWHGVAVQLPDGSARFAARFGRLGTAGQVRSNNHINFAFASAELTDKAHEKQLKGYATENPPFATGITLSTTELGMVGLTGVSLEGDPFQEFATRAASLLDALTSGKQIDHELYLKTKAEHAALEASYLQAVGTMELLNDVYMMKLEA